jgi:hypothetical protein
MNFREVLKAILLLRELDNMSLKEVAERCAKFSNQIIPDEVVESFSMTGLSNEDFLTSDFLEKYNLNPIQYYSFFLSF